MTSNGRRNWQTKPANPDLERQLADDLRLPRILARVLSSYDFRDADEARLYLDPKLKDVADPSGIPGMDHAVARIRRAILNKERILVFGDYDVDGITAAAVMVLVLRRLGAANVVAALPDRRGEGYGLSVDALRQRLKTDAPGLIVTVDCGITAVDAVQYARSAGVDVIITDHHEPGPVVPKAAIAVLNPKMGASPRLKTLAGVGVAFKLCHALVKEARRTGARDAGLDLRDYLDIVALGTVADIVPLMDENRILVRHGLDRINSAPSMAWREIRRVASIRGPVNAGHLGFYVAPRLNAAGRMASADQALELFLTENQARCGAIADALDLANRERQSVEARIFDEAVAMVDGAFDPERHFALVVSSRTWHPGVIGIVASRLVQRYHRPAIVIAVQENGCGRGSSRSIAGFNMLSALGECRDMLEEWGGHEMAAGFTIRQENIERFRAQFGATAARELKDKNLAPVLAISAWIDLRDVTQDNYAAIERMSPFGQDNPRPVFAARGVEIASAPRVVGKNNLRLEVGGAGLKLNAVAFNQADRLCGRDGPLARGAKADIAFHIKQDSFNGENRLELNILDCQSG